MRDESIRFWIDHLSTKVTCVSLLISPFIMATSNIVNDLLSFSATSLIVALTLAFIAYRSLRAYEGENVCIYNGFSRIIIDGALLLSLPLYCILSSSFIDSFGRYMPYFIAVIVSGIVLVIIHVKTILQHIEQAGIKVESTMVRHPTHIVGFIYGYIFYGCLHAINVFIALLLSDLLLFSDLLFKVEVSLDLLYLSLFLECISWIVIDIYVPRKISEKYRGKFKSLRILKVDKNKFKLIIDLNSHTCAAIYQLNRL